MSSSSLWFSIDGKIDSQTVTHWYKNDFVVDDADDDNIQMQGIRRNQTLLVVAMALVSQATKN